MIRVTIPTSFRRLLEELSHTGPGASRPPRSWQLRTTTRFFPLWHRAELRLSLLLFSICSVLIHLHLIAQWIITRTAKLLKIWTRCQGMSSSPLPGSQFFLLRNGLLFLGVVKSPALSSKKPSSHLKCPGTRSGFLASPLPWLFCCLSRINFWDPAWKARRAFSLHRTDSLNGNGILGWKYFTSDLGHCLSSHSQLC